MARPSGFGGIARALTDRNFRIWTVGTSISLIGSWIQRMAVAWLAWKLTNSGAWLGVVAFADLMPTLFVGPVAGALADRWDRMRVTKVAQALLMLQAITLFVLTATDIITIHLLVGLAVCLGVLQAFNQPARLALLPSLVRPENVPTAVAINAIVFNIARFIGPAVAGVVIVQTGVAAAFAINAVTFAFFQIALARIRLPAQSEIAPRSRQRALFRSLVEGTSYVARHPGIGPLLMIMVAVAILGRPFVELFAGFADEVFGAGAQGLAVLTSTVGLGAIGAGLMLTRRSDHRGLTRVTLNNVIALALSVLVFVATDRLWVAVPAAAVAGYSMVTVGVSVQTLLQIAVDGAYRGRALSIYGIIFRAGPGLGALFMGAASESLGLRWPVAAGAVLLLATAAWTWGARRRLAEVLEGARPRVPVSE